MMNEKFVYTKHAEERIKMRNIKKKDVEQCIINMETVEKRNEVTIAQKTINEKILRVVYRIEDNAYIIITAYLTTRKKYKVGEKDED